MALVKKPTNCYPLVFAAFCKMTPLTSEPSHDPLSGVKPFVSVIIPVFSDAERLRICLMALEQQTYPRSFYEVIVVDNGSNKGHTISGLVAQFGQTNAAYPVKK